MDSAGQPFVYHTLADIETISSSSGSENGGQFLTITGSGFDENPGQTQVLIGGQECQIREISLTSLTCLTPAVDDTVVTIQQRTEDTEQESWAGNAGLKYELWLDSELNPSDTWEIFPSVAPNHTTVLSQGAIITEPLFNETNGYVGRMSGYLVAPYTGEFEFWIAASDKVALYVSNTSSLNDTMLMRYWEQPISPSNDGKRAPNRLFLEGGQKYFVAAVHHQQENRNPGNFLRINIKTYTTTLTREQTAWSYPEEQTIYLQESKRDEVQIVQINGDILNNFHFTLNGVNPRVPFNAANPTETWEDQFEIMLNPRCRYNPEYLDDAVILTSDGDANGKISGQQGWIRSDIEAYCGKGLIQDGYRHFHYDSINLKIYPYTCFAYKGAGLTGKLAASIKYTKSNGKEGWIWIDVANDLESSEDADWQYDCWNVADRFDEIYPQERDRSKPFKLIKIDIQYSYAERRHSYVDELRFAKVPIEITREPALPFDEFIANTPRVEEETNTNENDYKIDFFQFGCPTERFPLLGITSETPGTNCTLLDLDTNDESLISSYLSDDTNENATFYCDDWPQNTSILIKRHVRMSLAMQGSYSLTYKNNTINVPIYTNKYDLYPLLDSNWDYACELHTYNYCWYTHHTLKWSCEGGDKPLIEIDSTGIVSDNTTLDFGVWQKDDDDGHLFLWEMGPDFFRTPHKTKQVQVTVNDYIAWCSADDCSYTYDAGLISEIDSMTQADGLQTGDMDLSFVGNGFTSTDDVIVEVGDDLVCDVTGVSNTTIDCTVTQPPAGQYDVKVFIMSKGEPDYPTGELLLSVPLVISELNPSSGSLGGGTSLEVTGTGFDNTATVSINGNECTIQDITSTTIMCITPPSDMEDTYDVVISLGTENSTFNGFTYDSSSTPMVTSLSPTESSSPKGGETLTIAGTAFGNTTGTVKICGKECSNLAWSETTINCTLPENVDNDCDPVIEIPGNGFAGVQNVPPISYRFRVTGMTPSAGSLLGGTKVKITGQGFTDDECLNLKVNLGQIYSCQITECMDTYILCETSRNVQTLNVRNQGSHPKFGYGYKWSPQYAKVFPGDEVLWQWSLGSASEDKGVNVHQVESLGKIIFFH